MNLDVTLLADLIAEKVLERLRGGDSASCVVLVCESDDAAVSAVREHIEETADVRFLGEDVHGYAHIRYIVPSLSCTDMADLALGRASGSTAGSVLRLLLSGTEVEVLQFEYEQYRDTAAGSLYALYESYRATLAGFGLKALKRKRPDTLLFHERLVTADTVVRAHAEGALTLTVPADAKITPLAVDTARELHISILKRF